LYRHLSSNSDYLHSLLVEAGNVTTEDKEKADVLNAFFTSVFKSQASYPHVSPLSDLAVLSGKLTKPPHNSGGNSQYGNNSGAGGNYNSGGTNPSHGSNSGKSAMFCDFCKRTGHIKAKCYKLHGYPQNNNQNQTPNGYNNGQNFRQNNQNYKGKRVVANVHSDTSDMMSTHGDE